MRTMAATTTTTPGKGNGKAVSTPKPTSTLKRRQYLRKPLRTLDGNTNSAHQSIAQKEEIWRPSVGTPVKFGKNTPLASSIGYSSSSSLLAPPLKDDGGDSASSTGRRSFEMMGGAGPVLAIDETGDDLLSGLGGSPVRGKISDPVGMEGHDQISSAAAPDEDSLKAYIRIRPAAATESDDTRKPYLQVLSDTTVATTARASTNLSANSRRTSDVKYHFTKVFTERTNQNDFFRGVGLPLVEKVLKGGNALMFAYGVTNSGKTYTIQGKSQGREGIVPRSLDTIFKSMGDRHSNLNVRPTKVCTVELDESVKEHEGRDPALSRSKTLNDILALERKTEPYCDLIQEVDVLSSDEDPLPDRHDLIDQDCEYAIFISHCEIYNEKIYDLFDVEAVKDALSSHDCLPIRTPSKRKAQYGAVDRKSLSLMNDPETGFKYIAGQHAIRVRSAEDAKKLFHQGQKNRRCFSTLANRESSRSHCIFTIRIIRIPLDSDIRNLTHQMHVSRLSIIDLAGSERSKNTAATGDRLKEAGSINNSLMILGQCMKTMRNNQSSSKRREIVPFRHSKLTEIFQSFFACSDASRGKFDCGGQVAMVVNVNPYDTSFEEIVNVMKFSAIAREVRTAPRRLMTRIYNGNKAGGEQEEYMDRIDVEGSPNGPVITSLADPGDDGFDHTAQTSDHAQSDDDDDDDAEDDEEKTLLRHIDLLEKMLYDAEKRAWDVEQRVRAEMRQALEDQRQYMEACFEERIKAGLGLAPEATRTQIGEEQERRMIERLQQSVKSVRIVKLETQAFFKDKEKMTVTPFAQRLIGAASQQDEESKATKPHRQSGLSPKKVSTHNDGRANRSSSFYSTKESLSSIDQITRITTSTGDENLTEKLKKSSPLKSENMHGLQVRATKKKESNFHTSGPLSKDRDGDGRTSMLIASEKKTPLKLYNEKNHGTDSSIDACRTSGRRKGTSKNSSSPQCKSSQEKKNRYTSASPNVRFTKRRNSNSDESIDFHRSTSVPKKKKIIHLNQGSKVWQADEIEDMVLGPSSSKI